MQIPIINGIYTSEAPDFRTSYPVNLVPVPKENGISQGYLRPARGIIKIADVSGLDRGGVNWNGVCYRVVGQSLIKIDSNFSVIVLGIITGTNLVTFDYSFTLLSIAADNKLYYFDGLTLTQNNDPDLGLVIDQQWCDGYFITTDGNNIVVTELNDPYSVNTLKYGSSEADPDPIVALLKLRREVIALNRYTIESFENVGGSFFPYSRIEGAQIQRGCVGTHACDIFMQKIAFVGGGRNEPCSVWVGINGQSDKISTREIDQILKLFTEDELSNVVVEALTDNGHMNLYVHLPDRCLVYDGMASQIMQEQIWYVLSSGNDGLNTYQAKNHVFCYNKWIVGNPTTSTLGVMDDKISSHYGNVVGWEFGTTIIYNQGMGAIIHEMELVCLTGRVNINADPTIWTSYSLDGEVWSNEKPRSAGKFGQRNKRISWLQQGSMRHIRMQKFRGDSDSNLAIARLEARIEPLYV